MKTTVDKGTLMGSRIQELRKEKDITMVELAKMLDVSQPTISKWEQGKIKNIKNSTIVKLANILGCSPLYLIGLSDDINAGFETNSAKSVDCSVAIEDGFLELLVERVRSDENELERLKQIVHIFKDEPSRNALISYVEFLYNSLSEDK